MTRRNFVVGLECKNILTEAVSKRIPLKITNKHDTRWQVYKSGFLGIQGNRLVLSQPISDIEETSMTNTYLNVCLVTDQIFLARIY